MLWLLVTWVLSISPGQTPGTAVDASTLRVTNPTPIAELDLGSEAVQVAPAHVGNGSNHR